MNKLLTIKIPCVILALIVAAYASFAVVDFVDESGEKIDFYSLWPYAAAYVAHGGDAKASDINQFNSSNGSLKFYLSGLLTLGGKAEKDYEKLIESQKSDLLESLKSLGLDEKNGVIDGNELLAAYSPDNSSQLNLQIGFELLSAGEESSLTATVNGEKMKCFFDASEGLYVLENGLVCDEDGSVLNDRYAEFYSKIDNDFGYITAENAYEELTTFPDDDSYDDSYDENEPTVEINQPYLILPENLEAQAEMSVIAQMNNVVFSDGSDTTYASYNGWYAVETGGRFHYSSFEDFLDAYNTFSGAIEELGVSYAVCDGANNKITFGNVAELSGKSRDEASAYMENRTDMQTFLFSDGEFVNVDAISSTSLPIGNGDYLVFVFYPDGEGVLANYEFFCSLFTPLLIKLACSAAGLIVLLAILIILCGKRSGSGKIHLIWSDKVFILIRLLINLALLVGLFGLTWLLAVWHIEENLFTHRLTQVLASVISIAAVLVIFDLVLYFARNLKAHSLSTRVFIVWLFKSIKRRRTQRKEREAELPPVFKSIRKGIYARISAFLVGFAVISFFFAITDAASLFSVIALFSWVFGWSIYAVSYAKDIGKLLSASKAISNGESVIIGAVGMKRSLRPYAYALNNISRSTKEAIEKAVREKNTKTELITNISHDLKTPLTSIINYVDLLSQTNVENEKAQEYIAVLGEKSGRLKRLIEDLIEASKASTGNVEVHLEPISFTELCSQIVGEYEDEMRAHDLELVASIEAQSVIINADRRMIYRVLDNVMNNARKYSLPGTRVYLTLKENGGEAIFTLKNVSAAALNISADELKQRFVRGDISRTETGSGLGLSIAESFCELMNARLELEISGDLFEASICFNVIEKPAE